MITKLRIKHFKGFQEFTTPLQRLNLLVGGNNSGKTTLFHALQLFFWCMDRTVDLDSTEAHFRKTQVPAVGAVPFFAARDLFYNQQQQKGSTPIRIELEIETDSTPSLTFKIYRAFSRNIMIDGADQTMPVDAYQRLLNMAPVYIPGTIGITVQEEYIRAISQTRLIAEGRQNQVLRNLILRLKKQAAWDEFVGIVSPLFSLEGMEVPFNVDKDEWLTATYQENDCEFDLVSAGSGFLQTLNLLCFLFLHESKTALLDEPDSHMHDDLQRVVFGVLDQLSRQRNLQIIIATHSSTLVDVAGLDSVLLIDRKEPAPKQAKDPDELVPLLADQGLSLPPNKVLETLRTRKAVFVEGLESDWATFLEAFGETIEPGFTVVTRGLKVFETGGATKKWPFEAIDCFEKLLGTKLDYRYIVDRDFLTDAEVAQRVSRAKDEGRSLIHGERRHRESYLLVPMVLSRVLAAKWVRARGAAEPLPELLTEAGLNEFILADAKESEDTARAQLTVDHEPSLRGDHDHREAGMKPSSWRPCRTEQVADLIAAGCLEGHTPAPPFRVNIAAPAVPGQPRSPMHLRRAFFGHRAYAVQVVLTLTLAVGANLLVFTFVNALWLRPRPVAAANRVVVISNLPGYGGDNPVDLLRSPMLDDFRRRGVFDAVAGQVAAGGLMGDFRPRLVLDRVGRPVETLAVTAQYFSVLGVGVRGRDFSTDDDRIGAAAVAIISDDLWQHAFDRAPDVVGETVSSSYLPIQVIGVAPAGFRGARLGEQVDIWIPRDLVPRVSSLATMAGHMPDAATVERLIPLVGLARLRPGITSDEAERAIAQPNGRFIVRPLQDVFGTPNRPTIIVREPVVMRILGVTAALVLAGGCATLMALVLVHYERRRQELAVRAALGASRRQLVRDLGLELLALAATGAASALAVTAWALRVIPALSLPDGIDIGRLDLAVDWRVATVGVLATVGTLAAATVVPIVRFSRANLVHGLVSSTIAGAPSSFRIRRVMLGLHVAATLVVLVAAGLFLRTVAYGFGRGSGVDPARAAFLDLQPSVAEFFEPAEGPGQPGADARKASAYARLLEGLRALPGIESVAIGPSPLRPDVTAPLRPSEVVADSVTHQMAVMVDSDPPGYLQALGAHLVAGRGLTSGDATTTSVRPAIVTASFAAGLWPGDTALGREFTVRGNHYDVIGVVSDIVCNSLRVEACGRVFTAAPAGVSTRGLGVDLTLKAQGDAAGLVEPARRLAAQIFPNASSLVVRTGRDLVAVDLGQERLGVWFFSGFGLVVLALGLGGVFGLVAYMAESKRREFGLRMALGATHVHLLRGVVFAGLSPVAVGTGIGLIVSAALTRMLDGLLIGVTRLDPLTYSAAAGIMIGGALLGGLAAAWRIHGLSPLEALRSE